MNKKFAAFFLLLVISINILWGIGSVPLLDPDEPVYAETARELIEFNDYLSPRIFNEYWYDKPPMYYWLVAGAFKITGVSDFSARLPSGILGIATVFMLYLFLMYFNFSRGNGVGGNFTTDGYRNHLWLK